MDIQTLADSPRNERGGGQVSRLLLTARQFGSRQLSVTLGGMPARGTLVFVPSATPHAIHAIGGQRLVYVSATSPPFEAAITSQAWEIPHVRL